jgi:hypothetical protein
VFIHQADGSRRLGQGGPKFIFAGVVAAVFFREEASQVVPGPVPANRQGAVIGSEMIDLGLVIKAQAVIDVMNADLGRWRE